MLAIVLVAQVVSACCSRSVTSEVRGRTTEVRVDSVVVGTMEVAHDTIVETTIITVRENEAGDTLRLSRVTERDRICDRAQVKDVLEKVVVKTDTVFVERRDSVLVQTGSAAGARASPFENTLKWVFFIVLALIGLILLLRIRR